MIKKILIKMLSDKEILKKSNGEIKNSETINYKTYKPEPNGLFCEKIFGPVDNYKCYCGKYNKKIYKNIICDICGVKITKNNIRRKNIGHIKLVIPITHIWFFKLLPNKISYLLNISSKKIYKIIYYEKYIIINSGNLKKKYKKNLLINESKYIYIKKKYKNKKFYIETGSKAILYLLKKININKIYNKFKKKIDNNTFLKKKKRLKRLKIIKNFKEGIKKGNKLTNIVFTVLPVIPPDLRPIVSLDNNKFASSDLNNFYKKIIIRNNRLKKIIKTKMFISNIIITNEKRLLQKSIDDLLDNTQNFQYNNNKKLKSLSDLLKGKYGRFRQNLLGKRVDYSARSVIVVNPNLKLYQCKIPFNIAQELYKPFIIKNLLKIFKCHNMKHVFHVMKYKKNIITFILKNIISNHPILLNRAPTLHRLSMLAFYPKLTNNKVIEIPPLVCSGFNADFDGDQMAIHVPLSNNSILETKLLMLSTQNILNISNGDPIFIPTQDMLLGLYYLTKKNINNKKYKNIIFATLKEVIIAYNNKIINLHSNIKLKYNNKIIKTTTGRVLFNKILPKNIKFINKLLIKNTIKKIIKKIYLKNTNSITVKFLDNIKKMGFLYSYKGGLSFGLDNIYIPKEKKKIILKNKKITKLIEKNYKNKLISKKEKYNKIINIWNNSSNYITEKIINKIKKDNNGYNPLFMMLESGARGTEDQIRQISGLKGLITKPNKNINYINVIKTPITSNFIEGLSVLEFFLSTHGARKGLADTALKTADAGYLTRRLVDCAQNIIINKYDCNTNNGIYIKNININIIGLYILTNVIYNNKYIIKKNKIITNKIYNKFKKYNIKNIYIRSILKCKLVNSVCAKCYGINLSTNKLVRIGEAVGVIAAQSIGEPGTQLTLKTFHVGGIIKNILKKNIIYSKYNGKIQYNNLKYIKIKNNKYLVISKKSELIIIYNNKILYKKNIYYGYKIYQLNNNKIKIGDKLYNWNPYKNVIYSLNNGYIKFNNLIKNKNYYSIINEYNKKNYIIYNINKKKKPYLSIINSNKKKEKKYYLYNKNILLIKKNQKISKGDPLIKKKNISIKYNDITGGLPKLSELFEMKKDKDIALLSEVNGILKYDINKKYIYIYCYKGYKKKYKIKSFKKILIKNNSKVKIGQKITKGYKDYNKLINIKGIYYTQKKIIKKIKNIYDIQGVNINFKHFEIILKQMTNYVKIIKSGNTNLLINNLININKFYKKNQKIYNKVRIIDNGDSKIYKKNNILNIKYIKIENYFLKLKRKKKIKYIKCKPAIGKIKIKGITQISLKNNSFISTSSFQETTKMLNKYSIKYSTDTLKGLKENVMIGNLIPSGTGYFYKK
ncbi:MAG: DNA-directed RNA polymerase subunit beta' [Candidatus Shikimatogenerans sp. Tduv]|uniref:DNA-directed RNA polymerase subunit beta' n=1 Tax=Candidatus Shikimatogenerans sp. Tduv TaxID=3158567 RepID=A0AAU7QR57_9FLAO